MKRALSPATRAVPALTTGLPPRGSLGAKGSARWTMVATRGFRLDARFVRKYAERKANFGYNGLGELVYYRTYARVKDNGTREQWYETVERVVNGTFSMQERWMADNVLGWDEAWAQERAQDMFARIFDMKFLPPGRGLWCMGTSVTEERGLFAALNNCAFVSTTDVDKSFSEAFCFTMDASMLGVGVGFDTAGSDKVRLERPSGSTQKYLVPDTREGWVHSLGDLLESYVTPGANALEFDYSKIRKAGEPIRGFGGTSSGPAPLQRLHASVRKVLDSADGKSLSVTNIVDIMNLVGQCVVAGNVRRTAEIAFGDPDSTEYIELKNYKVNPQRAEYGWTSNNSVFAKLGMEYTQIAERIRNNGEPGFAWLDNMRSFGRMNGVPDNKDWRAGGGNPCLEQTLESHELCCLVETFPDHHESLEDYKATLEAAFLYAKTVTLGKTHWPKSNRVMLRNRRIGCSMSGIAQFVASRGMHALHDWAEEGYATVQACDEEYSELFAIPRSIKTTCVKPSGTVSLVAGATPGIHVPESRFYLRRIRINADSELLGPVRAAGYDVEPAETDPENTVVVSIPIDAGEGVRTSREVSMWEQLSMAAFMQKHWADNQVSCTVTFDDATEGSHLVNALNVFQYQLKGVSFLPRVEAGAYAQMPYEEITEETYNAMSAKIGTLDLSSLSKPSVVDDDEELEVAAGHRSKRPDAADSPKVVPAMPDLGGVSLGAGLPDSFCDTCNLPDQDVPPGACPLPPKSAGVDDKTK
ncbi:Adenosylcobalamin-dependent ribonucleoside-triphosphate reductase [Hondaea fermentalgiana]|uniref:ribonucleoside-triphosphate reductase (thioredoxin) n=1 Tax=Hondaea fermentalgiana TaxID=2315210 RepID=A0A2R5GR62_9STRA|nr:Adenosylcobalamin-dependent ribonucleoside-triphosphate reductase [Hondaea fermentalgiana]|eukprot:GBG30374.1 Adenosylcobalamin-dependent ribonucleoside-triphosphate reductase [Hondaea fermentalgiana]